MEPTLRQHGRSAMDFIVSLARANTALSTTVQGEIAQLGLHDEDLPDDLDARDAYVCGKLANSRAFALCMSVDDYLAKRHGEVAREAFEEIRDRVEPELDALEAKGPATLDPNPGLQAPDYYRDVWFHHTLGGWDGHDQQGYIHGELVHRAFVSKVFTGGDLFVQRRAVTAELPRSDYRDILELGTSAGHYTRALQETFPQAKITGVDLSAPMLRQALRVANGNDWDWRLLRRAAEDTGLPDASFDLVTGYSFFHEMPQGAIRAIYAEALRVLRPGGTLMIVDITPYAAQDKLGVWRADRGARRGGEPYWRESASLDWADLARQSGFVDVSGRGLGPRNFPWVVTGAKA